MVALGRASDAAAAHEAAAEPAPPDARQLRCNELLAASAAGDCAAFGALYAQSNAHLFAVVRRTIWHRGEAEDVLQEIYLKIWRHAGAFDPSRAHALTWMSRVARNHALDHLRRQAARLSLSGEPACGESGEPDDAGPVDASPRPDEWLEIEQQRRHVDRLLDTLSGVQRQVMLMAFREGRTQTDIAACLGAPLGSVKSWMRRALQHLKMELDQVAQGHHGHNA